MHHQRTFLALACSVFILQGCLSSGSSSNSSAGPTEPAHPPLELEGFDVATASYCDHTVLGHCMYPFPNNFFTRSDDRTPTELRVDFDLAGMPVAVPVDLPASPGDNRYVPVKTTEAKAINPEQWNRNDGFSPGSMLLAHMPGIDLEVTGAPRLTDLAQSQEANAPILVLNADTLERHLIWAELDANNPEPDQQALIIRPGKSFEEGQRYIAVIRNAKDADGELLKPNELFRAYRDGIDTEEDVFESRRSAMDDIFAVTDEAGIVRSEITLAWDFTIASRKSLTERLTSMRDEAFERLGGGAPAFTVTGILDDPAGGLSRNIVGTFDVPNYLNQAGGGVGSTFNYESNEPDALPQIRNGSDVLKAKFRCQVPSVAVADFSDDSSQVIPGRAALYGHGLFGQSAYDIKGGEFGSGHVRDMQSEHNIVFCATDWIGMAQDDIVAGNIHRILADLSDLPKQLDRSQQGLLNFMYLAELMRHPDGFSSHAYFKHGPDNTPVFDRSEVFYDGNSQGGILGGALIATAPNIHRGVLGVPGSNYSLLLRRYGPFNQRFGSVLYEAYPDGLDQSLNFALMQMLWDRAENNGYLGLLNEQAEKKVLLHVALGDYQVTQWSAEIMARTIGAAVHEPTARLGESPDSNPLFDIPRIEQYPHAGHGLMIWDSGGVKEVSPGSFKGNPFPPTNNTGPDRSIGNDPHESPRKTVAARQQKSDFMKSDGAVTDQCGDMPCFSDDYTGVSRDIPQ